ncbi:MAG: AAA family ATPase [Defluviitaleaceae bacterium]|nr:AAA family ATPase [Defluviitaleaceae bacterium]
MIICPECGELPKDGILIHSEKLRKQRFGHSPILPICKQCGSDVDIIHRCTDGDIIVLNGTCGSGKSTVAEILVRRSFYAIDGDCVIQTLKHKKGVEKVSFQELAFYDEVGHELDILSMYGNRFVLAHVLKLEDMERYTKVFKSRNLRYHFFLLKPRYEVAVERCQTRTCHTSITPEQWIRHFYDLLVFDNSVEVVDNSDMTAEVTGDYILEKCNLSNAIA